MLRIHDFEPSFKKRVLEPVRVIGGATVMGGAT